MIVKRIRCKRGRAVSKPRHRHATDTIDYINLPHKKSASEHASDTVSYVLDTEREQGCWMPRHRLGRQCRSVPL